jgi:predicted DNA-binding ribbon-helix-helix protein
MTDTTIHELCLSALEAAALQKAAKVNEDLAKEIEPGQHKVDAVLRIRGDLKKGNPSMRNVNAFPWQTLAVALANRVNEATLRSVSKAIMDKKAEIAAATQGKPKSDATKLRKEMAEALKPQVEALLEEVKDRSQQRTSGNLTGSLVVDVLRAAEEAVQDDQPTLGVFGTYIKSQAEHAARAQGEVLEEDVWPFLEKLHTEAKNSARFTDGEIAQMRRLLDAHERWS